MKTYGAFAFVGAPVIRPLWWNSPTDVDALSIGNQFLVGDTLMVAPVLSHGTRNIDIYLPEGEWRDEIYFQDVFFANTPPKHDISV